MNISYSPEKYTHSSPQGNMGSIPYTLWGQGQKEKGKEKTLTFPLIAD